MLIKKTKIQILQVGYYPWISKNPGKSKETAEANHRNYCLLRRQAGMKCQRGRPLAGPNSSCFSAVKPAMLLAYSCSFVWPGQRACHLGQEVSYIVY